MELLKEKTGIKSGSAIVDWLISVEKFSQVIKF